jgi:UDP-N-acetylglucosamine 2-epimerase (non-hydrolysing)
MIDSLLNNLEKINNQETYKKYNLEKNSYGLITIHRPSNVDTKEKLERILQFFNKISKKIKLIIPLHPRTRKNIENFDLMNKIINNANIIIIEPA